MSQEELWVLLLAYVVDYKTPAKLLRVLCQNNYHSRQKNKDCNSSKLVGHQPSMEESD